MSRKKISQLEEATDITANDLMQVVDVEDIDMANSGTNKKITAQLLANDLAPIATGSTTARKLKDRFADTINVKDFGAVGNGITDDTVALNSAFLAAVGKQLFLDSSKTYLITSIIIPSGVTLVSNNSVFRKSLASTTAAITIQGNFTGDTVSLSSPGGASDVGIRVSGSNVKINSLISTSDLVDSSTGIRFQSTNGTSLEGILIQSINVSNFLAGVLIYNVGLSEFNNIQVTTYRTAVYLRDVYKTKFDGANIALTSPSATGAPGQNGLLVESTLSSSSSNNLRFSNWNVANAPEHGYRFGGILTIQDVWLTNCRSTLSGNAGASATGGCGFKVLGATITTGQRHRDFFFDNCIVEDVSSTGDGIGNFAGFLISVCDNVHISNCSVLKRLNEYSCWHGYSFENVTDTFLTNNVARDCKQHGIRFIAATYAEFPGWTGENDRIKIIGGYYDVDGSSSSAVIRFDPGGGYINEMTLSGVVLSGGNCAVRYESGITYTKNYFDLEYTNPGNTSGAPPLQGDNSIRFNYRGLYYGSYSPAANNGSYYLDTTSSTMRVRRNGAWIVISDIDYGTYSPTVTGVTNLDSASLVGSAQYFRFGNIVTVSGVVLLDPTATGSISCGISLPVASNFTGFTQCSGISQSADAAIEGTITADFTNDRMSLTANSTTTSSRNVSFHATYSVV